MGEEMHGCAQGVAESCGAGGGGRRAGSPLPPQVEKASVQEVPIHGRVIVGHPASRQRLCTCILVSSTDNCSD